MSKQSIKRSRQSGFTLIELVVVIVILGILAATAIPKFTDLSSEARAAKLQAGYAAVKSANATVHAKWLAAGLADNAASVTLEGVPVALTHGYPSSVGIVAAAGGMADYSVTATTGSASISPDSSHKTNCVFTFADAASAGAAPAISTIDTSAC